MAAIAIMALPGEIPQGSRKRRYSRPSALSAACTPGSASMRALKAASFICGSTRGKPPSSELPSAHSSRRVTAARPQDFGFRFWTRRKVWSPMVATW